MPLAHTRRRGGFGALAFWTVAVALGTQLWGDLAAAMIIDLAFRALSALGAFMGEALCACVDAAPNRAAGGAPPTFVLT